MLRSLADAANSPRSTRPSALFSKMPPHRRRQPDENSLMRGGESCILRSRRARTTGSRDVAVWTLSHAIAAGRGLSGPRARLFSNIIIVPRLEGPPPVPDALPVPIVARSRARLHSVIGEESGLVWRG
ncbi:hypothetical protein CMUS01_03144 [Colletotrichum musicola]|uniref:Uncharacterized protein n=1 Tax=Colletotrichum musicola TaxID=2175873 RepID=A0A8H6NTK1_9PEZI|nr:hypothetical protein CMUS01_03144 [Colletotrichum musicola]